MGSRGNFDHHGLRWSLGGHGFSFVPRSSAAPMGWFLQSPSGEENEILGRVPETEQLHLEYEEYAESKRYSHVTLDIIKPSPDSTGTTYQGKSIKKDREVFFGNQAVRSSKGDIYSWWHSNYGDLPLEYPIPSDNMRNYIEIAQVRPYYTAPYINFIRLGYVDNEEKHYISIIHPILYKNGKGVFNFNEGSFIISGIIAGIHPLDDGGVLAVVVESLRSAYFYHINKSFDASYLIGSYESEQIYGEHYPWLNTPICRMRHPWRFSESGNKCSTIVGEEYTYDQVSEFIAHNVVPKVVTFKITFVIDDDGNKTYSCEIDEEHLYYGGETVNIYTADAPFIPPLIETESLYEIGLHTLTALYSTIFGDAQQPIALNYIGEQLELACIDYSSKAIVIEDDTESRTLIEIVGGIPSNRGETLKQTYEKAIILNADLIFAGNTYSFNSYEATVVLFQNGSRTNTDITIDRTSHSLTKNKRELVFLDIKNNVVYFEKLGVVNDEYESTKHYSSDLEPDNFSYWNGTSSRASQVSQSIFYKDNLIEESNEYITLNETIHQKVFEDPYAEFPIEGSSVTLYSIYQQTSYAISCAVLLSLNKDLWLSEPPFLTEYKIGAAYYHESNLIYEEKTILHSSINQIETILDNASENQENGFLYRIESISPIGIF